MPKVKFVPQNIELEIKPNQSVLDLAHQNDIHIQSICKGVPSCAECRIQIKEGEWNVIPPLKKEQQLIGTAWFVDRSRLSCQLKCFGDVTIDLSQQIEKEQNAKRPRGKFQKDPKDSKAVTGSVLFEEPKVREPSKEPQREPLKENRPQHQQSQQRHPQQNQQRQNQPQQQRNQQRPQQGKPHMNAEDYNLQRAEKALQQEEIRKQLEEIKRKKQQLNNPAPETKDEES